MNYWIILLIYFLIGLFAGLMSGIFGIGGGSIRTPLLNVAGLPLLTAFGINLFTIPFSCSVGAYSHRKNINYRVAFYLIVGGSAGSILGALIAFYFSFNPLILASIFVGVSIVTVLGVNLYKIFPQLSKKFKPLPAAVVSGGVILNTITGMRGGSGGSLFPPFLRALNLDMHEAIATSLFTAIFTASIAMGLYWYRGNIDWIPASVVLLGSIIGPPIGSKISIKSKPRWLEIGLSIVVILLSLLTIYKALK